LVDLNYDDIAGILKVIDASSIDDLHLEFGGFVLDVKRNGTPQAASQPRAERPPRVAPAAPPAAPATAAAPAPRVTATTPIIGPAQFAVTAPMLGTCYLAPAPDAPPFVREGDLVAPGDALCIIEVMKLMNTITAERAGRVVKIAVENATMVEYGTPLIVFDGT